MIASFARRLAALSLLALAAACVSDSPVAPDDTGNPPGNNGGNGGTPPESRSTTGPTLLSLGLGAVAERTTAELTVRGNTAYTTTYGFKLGNRGDAVKIWDVSGNRPTLVDSVIVTGATTLGDIQVSDDGSLLLVAIENGGIALYALDTPTRPRLVARTTAGDLRNGVHTAELARVNGTLYAFCNTNPTANAAAKLVIVDLSTPTAPEVVTTLTIGMPFIHDVFVRDGLLFTAEWHDGVGIWDIGAQGGSVAAPRRISLTKSVGGYVHNVWWYHDPSSNSKRYMFVGEERPLALGSASRGDVHVFDVSNLAAPREVAAYNTADAGAHNFWVDEASGLLYAAFFNGGVRVIDVRGDLGTCPASQRYADGRCDLGLMGREKARFVGTAAMPVYVWGVQLSGDALYASDMLNGIWKLQRSIR